MMKLLKKGESGQTLIMALMLLALGSLLVIPLLQHTFTNLGYHQLVECRTLNIYSADAGVEYATSRIYNNPGAYLATPLQDGFTINNRTVNVTAEYQGGGIYGVISTASGGSCGRTSITTLVKLDHGVFEYVLAGKAITKVEYSFVTAESGPGDANIRSNDKITVVGPPALVDGSAYAVGIITGQEYITGDKIEGAEVLTFPDPYAELYELLAKEGDILNDNLDISDGGTHYLGPLYIDGHLHVTNGSTVILEGPLYVTSNIDIVDSHLDGRYYVFSEASITITGGGFGSDQIPVVIAKDGNIDIVGPVVDAVIYAPNGKVVVINARLYGAVAGLQCTVKNSEIIYAESLHGRSDLPGSEMSIISYSVE